MSKKLTLSLNWSEAKSLQYAIAYSKQHVKKDSQSLKALEAIESQLEDFTQSSTLILTIGNCCNKTKKGKP